MKNEIQKLIEALKSNGGVTFVGFKYRDKDGELTSRLLNIGVGYKNALLKDVAMLSELRHDNELKETARIELLKSAIMSLRKMEVETAEMEQAVSVNNLVFTAKEIGTHEKRSDAQLDAYIEIVEGLKYHPTEQKLYVSGMSVKKTIIEAVEKADTRKPLTKAKDEMRKAMKSTKVRNMLIESIEGGFAIKGKYLYFNGTENENLVAEEE